MVKIQELQEEMMKQSEIIGALKAKNRMTTEEVEKVMKLAKDFIIEINPKSLLIVIDGEKKNYSDIPNASFYLDYNKVDAEKK